MQNPGAKFNSNEYDDTIRRTLPYYDEFYRQVIDVVNHAKPDAVSWLDVGCGTGRMARDAFDQSKLTRFVFSDRDPEMIEAVKKRFPYPNAEYYVGESGQLPWQGEFDVVTAIQVHHYLQPEERRIAVSNCYRALKEDGIFITFENFAPCTSTGKELYLDRWMSYQLAHGKSEEACDKHRARYGTVYFPITIEEHMSLMRNCGFKVVEVLWVSYMQVGLIGIK